MTHFPCPPQAVIFDMDGLLFNSERLWKIAETGWLASYGYHYDEEAHIPLVGLAIPEYIEAVREIYSLEQDAATLMADLMARINHIVKHNAQTQPGALEIVAYVMEQGLPYAIASSSPLDLIDITVGTQPAWAGAFLVRCSADEVPRGKPAPDVYLLAAERLGVDPARCLALEDSPNGSRSAVAAGMTCFAVPDTTHSQPEAFANITPFVFHTLHDVLDHLRQC
jgi:HAD superfamily hydrolase (TIGR01509 family)